MGTKTCIGNDTALDVMLRETCVCKRSDRFRTSHLQGQSRVFYNSIQKKYIIKKCVGYREFALEEDLALEEIYML